VIFNFVSGGLPRKLRKHGNPPPAQIFKASFYQRLRD
jgi:hypothetical protein